jgi:S-adenosylmethionine hydrolase
MISFPTQTAPGTYSLTVGPNIQDWYGNLMNQNRNGVNGEASDAFIETIRQTASGSSDLLSITGVSSPAKAGAAQNFTVTVLSPTGGTDTSYLGTVQFTSSDPNAVFSQLSYTFTAADAGTHNFSITFKTAGWQSITASDTVNQAISGTEDNILVQGAAAQSIRVTGFPSPVTAGTAETFSVTMIDTYGNMATGYTGLLSVTSSDPQAARLANYQVFPEQQDSFTFTATLKTAGMQTLRVTDNNNSSITGSEPNITVNPAALSTLRLINFPSPVTAGTSHNVTVAAVDAYGNVVTSYSGTVHFTSTDPLAVLPANYTFTSGQSDSHNFSVVLKSAGVWSITATDIAKPSLSGTQSNITVSANTAASLTLTGFPTTATAGTAYNVTVTAHDAYGNVATGYTGKVHFSSTDPKAVLPADFTFAASNAGTASFPITLETVGSRSITIADTATPSLTMTQSGITVNPASAQSLTLTGFPTTAMAGTGYNVTITAYDAYGNVASGYTGKIHFSSTDSKAVLPADFPFTTTNAGTANFAITLETAGSQSITVADTATPSLTMTQSGITVNPASAQSLSLTGFPTTAAAGTAYNATVTAYDAYGNVASGYTGKIHFSSTDPKAVLPADFPFAASNAGTAAFAITLETAGPQSITVADTATPSLTSTESGITVQSAALSLAVTGFPTTATAGTTNSLKVTAYNPNGSVDTAYTGTVHFTSTDPKAVLPADFSFTIKNAGTASFSIRLLTSGLQSITATDTANPTITGVEQNITVNPSVATSLSVSGIPSSATAGTAYSFKVMALDNYGNVATGYTGTVQFTSNDLKAILPANYTFTSANAGVATVSAQLLTVGSSHVIATNTLTSNINGGEFNIKVHAATAQTFSLTGFPTSLTAGTQYGVSLTAYDAYGNLATGYTGTVHFTSNDPQAILPADYTFTSSDSGSHKFVILLKSAGVRWFTATDTATPALTITDSNITVNPAAAHSLSVTGFPSPAVSGTAYGFTVTAYDAYGNVATGYTGTIHFTSSDSKAVLPANYPFTTANAGVATFSATLVTIGTQNLKATDTVSSSINGTEGNITVIAGGGPLIARLPILKFDSLTVTADHGHGKAASGETGTILFSSSDAQPSFLPGDSTLVTQDVGVNPFGSPLTSKGMRLNLTDEPPDSDPGIDES